MPRIRQKAAEYRRADFLKAVEKQKIERGIRTDRELADRMGMTPRVLCSRKKDFDNMSVGEFRILIATLDMTPAMVLPFLGVKAHE